MWWYWRKSIILHSVEWETAWVDCFQNKQHLDILCIWFHVYTVIEKVKENTKQKMRQSSFIFCFSKVFEDKKKRETSVICIYLVHSTNILNDVTGPSLSHMNACCLQNAHLQEPGSKAGVKLNSGAPMWDPGIHSSGLTWYGTILSPHLLLHVLL